MSIFFFPQNFKANNFAEILRWILYDMRENRFELGLPNIVEWFMIFQVTPHVEMRRIRVGQRGMGRGRGT